MRCNRCGTENADGTKFCVGCGAAMPEQQMNQGYANPVPPVMPYAANPVIPEEYKPISMWGYFGYQLLFAIPLVGFIMLLVYSFGGTKNINLKNFARSYFCIAILVVALLLVFSVLIGGMAVVGSTFY